MHMRWQVHVNLCHCLIAKGGNPLEPWSPWQCVMNHDIRCS